MANIFQAVEQQYLTKAQARTYTGLSERSIDYARTRGDLPCIKYGKRVLLKRADLDALLDRHRVGADLDKIIQEVH